MPSTYVKKDFTVYLTAMLEFDMMKMLAFVSIQGLEQKFVVPVPSDSLNCHGQNIPSLLHGKLKRDEVFDKEREKRFRKNKFV